MPRATSRRCSEIPEEDSTTGALGREEVGSEGTELTTSKSESLALSKAATRNLKAAISAACASSRATRMSSCSWAGAPELMQADTSAFPRPAAPI